MNNLPHRFVDTHGCGVAILQLLRCIESEDSKVAGRKLLQREAPVRQTEKLTRRTTVVPGWNAVNRQSSRPERAIGPHGADCATHCYRVVLERLAVDGRVDLGR